MTKIGRLLAFGFAAPDIGLVRDRGVGLTWHHYRDTANPRILTPLTARIERATDLMQNRVGLALRFFLSRFAKGNEIFIIAGLDQSIIGAKLTLDRNLGGV
ncbi:MAG: hypothetical protein FJX52_14195 [Alphaproteobacteria bacterium]|nr:hypothetical protein [Alphaproteobacteria bacterium]